MINNNDELFTLREGASPRLKWKKKHGLVVKELMKEGKPMWVAGGFKACDGSFKFFSYASELSEEDAVSGWAKRSGTPLWNEEEFTKRNERTEGDTQ